VRKALTHGVALWTPPILWAAAIFAGSSRPSVPLPGVPGIDLAAHAAEYLVLCVLLARPLWRRLPRASGSVVWPLAILLCLLYAVTDEAHQAFVPGRYCDPLDVAADVTGACLGAIAVGHALPRKWCDLLGLGPKPGRYNHH
jgi:hypothetical protein